MIFSFFYKAEKTPLNHETVIIYIKAEENFFCFYFDINIFWNCCSHLHDYRRMTVFQHGGVQRSLK